MLSKQPSLHALYVLPLTMVSANCSCFVRILESYRNSRGVSSSHLPDLESPQITPRSWKSRGKSCGKLLSDVSSWLTVA